MDFFEQQDNARRKTKFLVLMFVLAVIGIVFAVDLVITMLVANMGNSSEQFILPSLAWAGDHAGLVGLSSLGTTGFIGLASLYRIASLNGGGGTVARNLGGTLVTPDTPDPLRRRLHNVVEEMAIASGVPVPEVYVLEAEDGINAFAAGFSPGDAAVAVTRGSLERFNRNELQGVIAHEFSHILNGDMRLNMRLIGILFGILVIGLIGRTILRGSRHVRISGSRDKGGGVAVIFILALSLTLIGYIGMFFGRLIKAAVSRQREYLADASAVQFTRQSEGIASALKKIGYDNHSVIDNADGEEMSHMFFANGVSYIGSLYATHPPIDDRIRALDPNFNPEEYMRQAAQHAKRASKRMAEEAAAAEEEAAQDKRSAQDQLQRLMQAALILTPEGVSQSVGNPSEAHVQHASQLRREIPEQIRDAAHSPSGALFLTLALLLDHDDSIREQQYARLQEFFRPQQIKQMTQLHLTLAEMGPQFRLPLMELTFPALKRRPPQQIDNLLKLIQELIEMDGHVDTFEYLLSRALMVHLQDAEHPSRVTARRSARLAGSVRELQMLFSTVAHLGHENEEQARKAYQMGMHTLLPNAGEWPDYTQPAAWIADMDKALEKLDKLPAMIKETLVQALVTTISHDNKVTINEAELLRAVCAILHCPLPPFLYE